MYGTNNEIGLQAGGQALMHEIGHTLGLPHTFFPANSVAFGPGSCIDNDKVLDTPSACGGVWDIPVTTIGSYDWCQNAWDKAGDSFAILYQRKAAGLGIRSDEQTLALRSCGTTSSQTPFVPVRSSFSNLLWL